jgi:hypothetical protein
MPLIYIMMVVMIGCGKVANDIQTQTTQNAFGAATFTFEFSPQIYSEWLPLVSTQNSVPLYVYLEGISFERGVEKAGWTTAEASIETVGSQNVTKIVNYDEKRNTVKSSRYMQGFAQLNKVATQNYKVTTTFQKVRQKYDFYALTQFLSKDIYQFRLIEEISTAAIQITPYEHVVSAVYLSHLKKESYNQQAVIPLSVFYTLIPTSAVTPTVNAMPNNQVGRFNPESPVFRYESPYLEGLMSFVSLSYFSNEYDAVSFVEAKDENVFSDSIKLVLVNSVRDYFKSKKIPEQISTENVDISDD